MTGPIGEHAAAALAQLLQGVPAQQVDLSHLTAPWREVAEQMAHPNGTPPQQLLADFLDTRADRSEIEAAIFRTGAPQPNGTAQHASTRRFTLFTAEEISRRPAPKYLIQSHLTDGGLSCLFSPSGVGKSFLGLEEACCIAAGVDLFDLVLVEQGTAVYVAAEGAAGLAKRLDAWKEAHPAADLSGLYFLDEPVNLVDASQVAEFIAELSRLPKPAVFVVFDTLARCLLGADENSSRDVGMAIANLDQIRRATGAHVQVIHHTSRAGDSERGSTALRGAVDTMLKLSAGDDGTLTLSCEKQKDAPTFERWLLRITLVEGTESCVLRVLDQHTASDGLSPRQLEVLDVLETAFGEEGASATQWLTVAKEAKLTDATFYRARKTLTTGGYVVQDRKRYRVTPRGRAELSLSKNSHRTLSESNAGGQIYYQSLSHPFRGDSDDSNSPAPLSGQPELRADESDAPLTADPW